MPPVGAKRHPATSLRSRLALTPASVLTLDDHWCLFAPHAQHWLLTPADLVGIPMHDLLHTRHCFGVFRALGVVLQTLPTLVPCCTESRRQGSAQVAVAWARLALVLSDASLLQRYVALRWLSSVETRLHAGAYTGC